jgi:hypothetical protein
LLLRVAVVLFSLLALGEERYDPEGVPLEIERNAARLLGVADETVVNGEVIPGLPGDTVAEGPDGEQIVRVDPTVAMNRGVETWFQEAWCRFGTVADTPAERRIIHNWLSEEMGKAQRAPVAPGNDQDAAQGSVRKADRMVWIPIVIEMMFIPTRHQVYASLLAQSKTVRAMKAMASPLHG